MKTKLKLESIPEKTRLQFLAVAVGLLCGFAAVLLKKLIELIQTALVSWFETPSDSFFYLLYPGVGMLLSLLFVRLLVKDDIGHGVTKVLLALSRNESRIKPHNTWSSIFASALTIGFGGSVGAEAPIVYSGAAIGSNIGRKAGLSYRNVTILLGCGAAAAIAGIFKAPLAGVLFALEILFFNVSMSSILPLLISSITATVVTYLFLGRTVAFPNATETFRMMNIFFYLVLGLFCGIMSLYFIRMTLKAEDAFRRMKNVWVRWSVCATSLGLLIFLFPPLFGEGYGALSSLLNNSPGEIAGGLFHEKFSNPWLFLLFAVCLLLFKVIATALTNAGGGVGGTFGPTLVSGGIAGFVVARLINLSGVWAVPEANFVLAGMAGMMAGVMQAPMTAIFLIAEITGGYEMLIPLIITSVSSFATIRIREPYSIYSKRIAARGDLLTHDSDSAVLTLLKTSELIEDDFIPVNISGNLGDLVKAISKSHRTLFPVLDDAGHFCGLITLDDVRDIMFDREKYDKVSIISLVRSAPAFAYDDDKMQSVVEKLERTGAWNLPVVDVENRYLGFISKSKVFTSYRTQLKQVSHE